MRIQYINALVTCPDRRICKTIVDSNVHTLVLPIDANDSTTWTTNWMYWKWQKHLISCPLNGWTSISWLSSEQTPLLLNTNDSNNRFHWMVITSVLDAQRSWPWSIVSLAFRFGPKRIRSNVDKIEWYWWHVTKFFELFWTLVFVEYSMKRFANNSYEPWSESVENWVTEIHLANDISLIHPNLASDFWSYCSSWF